MLFIFLPVVLAGTSGYIFDSDFEGGHPSLVPDVRGKALLFSPLSVMFTVYVYCLLTNLLETLTLRIHPISSDSETTGSGI